MDKNINCIIIGNNTRHAKLFSFFCNSVYLAIDNEKSIQNRLSDEINDFNCIFTNNRRKHFKYIKRIKEIKHWITNYNLNIVFTNTKFDLVCSKIATFGRKKRPLIVCTFHNSLSWQNKKKVKALSHVINFCADGCVCLANEVFNSLSTTINNRKLLFLPNSIDSSTVSKKTNYEMQKDATIRIAYTATIYRNKNQLFALEVLNVLKKKYKVSMDFIGEITDKQYYSLLINYVKDNNLKECVFFKGSVDNIDLKKNLLQKYDLYFSPSLLEMSPLNILEAKAVGLPIVASHAFGQKDLIDDGFDGLLYNDGNIDDALDKIKLLIENKSVRERIGKNARFSCAETKSMINSSKEMEAFISGLCKIR